MQSLSLSISFSLVSNSMSLLWTQTEVDLMQYIVHIVKWCTRAIAACSQDSGIPGFERLSRYLPQGNAGHCSFSFDYWMWIKAIVSHLEAERMQEISMHIYIYTYYLAILFRLINEKHMFLLNMPLLKGYLRCICWFMLDFLRRHRVDITAKEP